MELDDGRVEDILTECLGATVSDWFQPKLDHPFLRIGIVTVPEDKKSIPHLWIDDVQIDDLFRGDDGDPGPLPLSNTTWSVEDGRQHLMLALKRLQLPENLAAHPNIDRMDHHDLAGEKRRVKQELKRYDLEFRKKFTRWPVHKEKEPMRPLYVYYRRLKTMIAQADQTRQGHTSGHSGNVVMPRTSLAPIPDQEGAGEDREDRITALEMRIESLQSQKFEVRNKLQAFQEAFVSENNRKIRFHKDILPIERDYRMYKTLKEEIVKAEQQLHDLRAES